MQHRWTLADADTWRRLAVLAQACAGEMVTRDDCRRGTLSDLTAQAKRAFKVHFPTAEADWPRLMTFLTLAEDFAKADRGYRKSWTAALDTRARAVLRLIGDGPPAPQTASGALPWWARD